MLRSNQVLSQDEKNAKRDLKRKLKEQSKHRKLLIRLERAKTRGDEATVQSSLKALEALRAEHNEEDGPVFIESTQESPNQQIARGFIESTYKQLIARLNDDETTRIRKKECTKEARTLLFNMTKGTQQLDMFENDAALTGYTRHKFHERAMLMARALDRLYTEDLSSAQAFAHRLETVNCVCSIGCGPGCDAVGIVALFQALRGSSSTDTTTTTTVPTVERVVLLDWAMPQWKRVVEPLQEIVEPHVGVVQTASCDVRASLHDEINADARSLLDFQVDLYCASYLLSETRNKWEVFFTDAVKHSQAGTLFLLADPTAWQLHLFVERFGESLDFCWLDSSRHTPELQPLEGRVGPAILIGMKKAV